MLLYRPFFLLVAVALLLATQFIAATPFTASEDASSTPSTAVQPILARSDNPMIPSMNAMKWTGQATLEVYILPDPKRNSIGSFLGNTLLRKVWENLWLLCPDTVGNDTNKCTNATTSFPSKMNPEGAPDIVESVNVVYVYDSRYKSNQVRNLLMSAIAGTYAGSARLDGNCWGVNGTKFCHAPLEVAAFTEDSYMRAAVIGNPMSNNWFHCCESLTGIYGWLDANDAELSMVYPGADEVLKQVISLGL